jgi:hypothetical protein
MYWIRFTAPNGEQIRESAKTSDRKQAQEYHDQRKAEYWRVQKAGDRPRRTWQEAVVKWVDEKKHKRDLEGDLAKIRWLDNHLRS